MEYYLKSSSKILVVEKANEVGIKGKNGSEFNYKQLDIILKNAQWRYRGLWYANSENKNKNQNLLSANKRYQIVHLNHGPLIEIPLLNQVENKMQTPHYINKQRKISRAIRGVDGYSYLLTGLLQDEKGQLFTGDSSKRVQYSRIKVKV